MALWPAPSIITKASPSRRYDAVHSLVKRLAVSTILTGLRSPASASFSARPSSGSSIHASPAAVEKKHQLAESNHSRVELSSPSDDVVNLAEHNVWLLEADPRVPHISAFLSHSQLGPPWRTAGRPVLSDYCHRAHSEARPRATASACCRAWRAPRRRCCH